MQTCCSLRLSGLYILICENSTIALGYKEQTYSVDHKIFTPKASSKRRAIVVTKVVTTVVTT